VDTNTPRLSAINWLLLIRTPPHIVVLERNKDQQFEMHLMVEGSECTMIST
jgi:hypothetical protein